MVLVSTSQLLTSGFEIWFTPNKLIECMKWMPLGAVALTSVGVLGTRWKLQMPTINFFGIQKSLFIAPLLPAIPIQLITDKAGEGGHRHSAVKTACGVRRRLFQLRARTLNLRTISAYVFATYFVCLPALYFKFGLGSYVYTTIGIGYLLQAASAICYVSVHRRFFPAERGVRALHAFYNLSMPWHAMRAADELFLKSSAEWSELALLAATSDPERPNPRLALYWRQSQLMEASAYSTSTLSRIFDEIDLSPSAAMQGAVPQDAGQTYCPCCGAIYRADILNCVDCRSLALRKS